MANIAAVVQIRNLENYDVVLKGKHLRLKIEPCAARAFCVEYVSELEIPVPEGLRAFLGQGRKIEEPFIRKHVELKWWERAIGVSLESKVVRTARELHRRVKEIERGLAELDAKHELIRKGLAGSAT